MEQTFKHEIPLQLRFNDIDILGHLNNSVYFNFFDLGKSRYFEAVRGEKLDWHNADVVIASIQADFLAPVFYNEQIAVQTAVTEIGNKSFKMLQRIINTRTGQIKCNCTSIMVGFRHSDNPVQRDLPGVEKGHHGLRRTGRSVTRKGSGIISLPRKPVVSKNYFTQFCKNHSQRGKQTGQKTYLCTRYQVIA